MFIKIENENGSININRRIIEKIVKYTIAKYPEVISLTNSKGQISNIVSRIADDSHLVDVTNQDTDITVKVYIIMKFGVSINNTTQKIINEIKNNIHEAINIMPDTVYIFIKGIKAKKIAQRDIVIKG